jgi:hypothetical protein
MQSRAWTDPIDAILRGEIAAFLHGLEKRVSSAPQPEEAPTMKTRS